ncbi:hypothetical protein SRIMR7_03890 [Streptomyces rimosus subsp. rimosus]|uniref:Uncharacterized protein n=1 Tax=Streptomyces rimosus subsp. rimosus TaxID=132474 RepID=A0ABY3YV96_STRRM|nr:hypothetical protein SRIMR7_03890 [Streptomyces rimosus subsp. rimosus]
MTWRGAEADRLGTTPVTAASRPRIQLGELNTKERS